jgi:uncharacterized membrane protein
MQPRGGTLAVTYLHNFFTPAPYHAWTAISHGRVRTPATHRRTVLSGKQNKKRRTGGTQSPQASARQEKRAQFEQPKSRTGLHLTLAGIALVAVIAVAALVVMNRGGGETATATAAAAPGGDVTIPISQVNDGKAHFYSYDAGGTTVKYFVLADKNGKVRAALDACEVCFAQKKGYHQEGDTMVCNNCGKVFPSDQINVITGGCNPIPLDKKISGGQLTITTDSLTQGVQYF